MTASIEALARRYYEKDENCGHFERDAALIADPEGHLRGTVALRREEVSSWLAGWPELSGPVRRVLDAGCGPGTVALALADCNPGAEVMGIDVEPEAVELARALAAGREELRFVCAAIEDLSPSVGPFDLIVCRTTLEHVVDPKLALTRLIDMLGPGGVLFVETPNYLLPWEPHVALPMLPKSPKVLLRGTCRLARRDPRFVNHLRFECDPVTLARWARAHPRTERVVDLMARKATKVLEGGATSAVPSRQRLIDRVRRRPALVRLLARTTRLPVWPSASLLVIAER